MDDVVAAACALTGVGAGVIVELVTVIALLVAADDSIAAACAEASV